MKKILLLFMVLVFSSVLSATTLVDWKSLNGVIRASTKDYHSLLLITNAYRNDFYLVNMKVSNYPAGLWQAKINHPKVRTNWIQFSETMPTNMLHSFPAGGASWSNVVLTSYTQAFHLVINGNIASATNNKTYLLSTLASATNIRHTQGTSVLATATNTVMANLTNYFCWAEAIQTNFSVASFTPKTNTSLRGSNTFSLWTNVATSYASTANTNFIAFNSATRMFRIGGSGGGNYEMSYSLTYVSSSTNTFNFDLLFNNATKVRFLKSGGSGDASHSVSCSAIINVPATTTIGLGVVQANGQSSTIQLKNVVVWIRKIR